VLFTSLAVTCRQNVAAILAAATIIAFPTRAHAQATPTAQGAWGGKTQGVGHYADVNGIKLYYETAGTGRPLILLHGGLGAIEMFGPNLPALAKGRKVIAVDLQAHGRTADITPFLWFDNQAEEAMNFYTSIFRNSKTLSVRRYGEAEPGPTGSVMTGTFQLDGQEFMALNAGTIRSADAMWPRHA